MRPSTDFHKSPQIKHNRNMPGPRWNRYEKNIWQPGWLTEREERRTPGCWKFSGYNLQEGARQIRSNYDNGDDLGVMITIMISLLSIATHQEESYTQWQDASRSAGCSSETWKYRWLDIQSRRIHHHRHHHHHHHNCNALSPARKWMTLTGTQQRPRHRYSTTARPLEKFLWLGEMMMCVMTVELFIHHLQDTHISKKMMNDDAMMKSNTFPIWRLVCSTTVLRLMFDNRPRQNLASLVLRTWRQGQY